MKYTGGGGVGRSLWPSPGNTVLDTGQDGVVGLNDGLDMNYQGHATNNDEVGHRSAADTQKTGQIGHGLKWSGG